nr:MAG TPA: Protein of unknown function (DUF2730) [Caudoviricetes sp.]
MDSDDEELKATRILNGVDTREHRIYAIKFAVMQKQIDEKDKRIKELEEEKKNSIPKQKIKDKIKELANTKGDLATYIAVSERIKVLEELLELGEGD